ncbi:MAG TPA: GFA family protein [Kofleriaceae bacterium]|nr:GFA family protein [Kofleriaceae bacterium]
MKTYSGSCHCGAIRYEVDVDLAAGTTRCNCSFCGKNRFWMAIVKAPAVRILDGAEKLVDYQHVPEGKPEPFLHLYFCGTCGVRPFSKGGHLPALGSEFYAVNIATLDASPAELAAIPVQFVDGAHDEFAKAPSIHSYM